MSRHLVRLCFALCASWLPISVWSAAGDLDAGFGGGAGWVSTPFALKPSMDFANSLIQQADGRLVVAGYSTVAGKKRFAVTRYNSDGSLDTSFNGSGKLTMVIGPANDEANSVIQQTDGKLVVVGSSGNDFAVVRYNPDGSLDTDFKGGGMLTTDIGADSIDKAASVVQQLDGKLVVAGTSNDDFALVRYETDGSLDTDFNGSGKLTTAIGPSFDTATSVIQQADRKLVVAGYSFNGSNYDFALVRYEKDGSLDTTFNGTGKLTTAIGTSTDMAYSLIQQADGKLVVSGFSDNGSNNDFALVRYNTDGTLDTTFNGSGKLTVAFGSSSDIASSVIQQADGTLVAAGYSTIGSNTDFSVARFNNNGSLDATFNGTGKLTTNVGGSDIASSLIQQADGKLVVAGRSLSGSNFDFAIVRYLSNGTLDAAFDSDGILRVNIMQTSESESLSLAQQSDGKLVAAGYASNNGDDDFALVRYNPDGTLDTTFNGSGQLTTAIGIISTDRANAVIQQADGKLVAAGFSSGSRDSFALVRYNPDGSLDTTFNSTGKLTTSIGVVADEAYSVIQQADGKLVAAGYSNNGSNDDFALVRYNQDGSLDTTFNVTGIVTTAIVASNDRAYSVIRQADGKLVAAGYSNNGSNDDFALVRYNADGSLDTTFNGTGKVVTAIGVAIDRAQSVIQQADGKLVAAGSSSNDFALVRYNPDGSLDTTFNGTGKLTTAIGSSTDNAISVAQQADGKLVAAGYSLNGGNYDFALVRYNTDGSLDTAFSGDGKRLAAIGTSNDFGYSVIQQKDGKLAVAGYANNMPTGREFVVARFESGQLDSDGDGWVNGLDTDNDGDGIGNAADIDDDNDGIPDYIDADPLDGGVNQELVLPLDNPYSGSAISESVSP
jgi:uncharacterized delta-60 repeat protein